jgi:hypothetical protein
MPVIVLECPNCGANIEKDKEKCDYCGINYQIVKESPDIDKEASTLNVIGSCLDSGIITLQEAQSIMKSKGLGILDLNLQEPPPEQVKEDILGWDTKYAIREHYSMHVQDFEVAHVPMGYQTATPLMEPVEVRLYECKDCGEMFPKGGGYYHHIMHCLANTSPLEEQEIDPYNRRWDFEKNDWITHEEYNRKTSNKVLSESENSNADIAEKELNEIQEHHPNLSKNKVVQEAMLRWAHNPMGQREKLKWFQIRAITRFLYGASLCMVLYLCIYPYM